MFKWLVVIVFVILMWTGDAFFRLHFYVKIV